MLKIGILRIDTETKNPGEPVNYNCVIKEGDETLCQFRFVSSEGVDNLHLTNNMLKAWEAQEKPDKIVQSALFTLIKSQAGRPDFGPEKKSESKKDA